jgi:D-3-phosphoglycerate dehydrogenase
MARVLITTVPFGNIDCLPINLLKDAGIDYFINPLDRKLNEFELAEMVSNFDALIAGTEQISKKVMDQAKNLKLISRVGIGLDGVDLLEAERRGIKVSYTPDAPAPAVVELTLGLIFATLRSVHIANSQMHKGEWHRYFGRRIPEVTFGIIGAGRIGGQVIRSLLALGASKILVNDINTDKFLVKVARVEQVEKEVIYNCADVISLHVPLTSKTKNMINYNQLLSMKSDVILINTARGGIINEGDLELAMNEGRLGAVALDVFENEPYDGPLRRIERCLLTSHMGSMSIDCRTRMEIEATNEVIRFLGGEDLQSLVPLEEYDLRREEP